MIQTTDYLKSRFQNGQKPTAADFADLFDTAASANVSQIAPGQALQVIRTNSGGTAAEWADPSMIGFWVSQAAHGFGVGQAVYCTGVDSSGNPLYALATVNDSVSSRVIGIVAKVTSNSFFLAISGVITFASADILGSGQTALDSPAAALSIGSIYYVSSTSPGRLSLAQPAFVASSTSSVSYVAPVLFGLGSYTGMIMIKPTSTVQNIVVPSGYAPNINVAINSVILDGDDTVLLGGIFGSVSGIVQNRYCAYNSGVGTPGPITSFIGTGPTEGFSHSSGAPAQVWTACKLGTGPIVVGGCFNSYKGNTCNKLAIIKDVTGAQPGALLAPAGGSGSASSSLLASSGSVDDGAVLSVCSNADASRVWAVGTGFYHNGNSSTGAYGIACLDTTAGTADSTFHANCRGFLNGSAPSGQVSRVIVAGTNTGGYASDIIVAGTFTHYLNNSVATACYGLLRISTSGVVSATGLELVRFKRGGASGTLVYPNDIYTDGTYLYAVGNFDYVTNGTTGWTSVGVAKVNLIAGAPIVNTTTGIALDYSSSINRIIPIAGGSTMMIGGQFLVTNNCAGSGVTPNVTHVGLVTITADLMTLEQPVGISGTIFDITERTDQEFLVAGNFYRLGFQAAANTARITRAGVLI